MNIRALVTTNPDAINTVYNVAYGERTDLKELIGLLKEYLSAFDPAIANIEVVYGPERQGDVPHSLASIEKAKNNLGYDPEFSIKEGLKEAVTWYWNYLK
jgi:UDP-N-acetylglucosamine 4-epimerase